MGERLIQSAAFHAKRRFSSKRCFGKGRICGSPSAFTREQLRAGSDPDALGWGSVGIRLVTNPCSARRGGLPTGGRNQPRRLAEADGRHVVVDALVAAGKDEVGLVLDADVAVGSDAFVERDPGRPVGCVAVPSVCLQLLEGAPVLHQHRAPWAAHVLAGAEEPDSGLSWSSRSIHGIAKKTGSHFHIFQTLLIRMPIRKTTKSPSISAVTRFSIT